MRVVDALPGVAAGALPASPVCACAAGSRPAAVLGMPPALVPYDAPGVGCETPVGVASLVYESEAILVTLDKRTGVVDVNATLTLGGTSQQAAVSWSVDGALPSWLEALAPAGVASKPTSEPAAFALPLRLRTDGLREGVDNHTHTLRVTVGLDEGDATASIPVRLLVAAEPVAARCTVEPAAGASAGLDAAASVLGAPFVFVFVPLF